MERMQPIVKDLVETREGYLSRSLAQNISRMALGVTLATITVGGAVVLNYSAANIVDILQDAADKGLTALDPTVRSAVLDQLGQAVDSFNEDVTSLLTATRDAIDAQVQHFRNGTLVEEHSDFIKDLPFGEKAFGAFEWAISRPLNDNGSLADRVGADAVGIAALCLIGGLTVATGRKAVMKGLNIAAKTFASAREMVSRIGRRLRGIEEPAEPRIHDPFTDPVPATISGNEKSERELHERFAKVFKDAGLPEYKALGLSDTIMASFIALGHENRALHAQMDRMAASQAETLAMMRVRMEQMQQQLRQATDLEGRREEIRAVIAELSEEAMLPPAASEVDFKDELDAELDAALGAA